MAGLLRGGVLKPKNNQRKSKPGRGGKRKGAGRKAGSANKVTVLIKASLAETAKAYTAEMLGVLIEIAVDPAMTPGARVTAAQAVLERGHGKPVQPNTHSGPDGGPIETKDVSDIDRARRIAFFLGVVAAKKDKP